MDFQLKLTWSYLNLVDIDSTQLNPKCTQLMLSKSTWLEVGLTLFDLMWNWHESTQHEYELIQLDVDLTQPEMCLTQLS